MFASFVRAAWLASAPLFSAQTTTPPARFGGFEFELANLAGPSGAVITARGEFAVLESFRARVVVFDANGKPLRDFGGLGGGEGKLCDPRGLALTPDGDFVVADTANDRISVFARDGRWLTSFGQHGSGPSEFCSPMGVAASAEKLVVADARNHRIQIFARDGAWERAVGTLGSAPVVARASATDAEKTQALELRSPVDVALDARGRIFVADQGNHRIVRTDAIGRPELAWGVFGSLPGQLASPSSVRVAQERVYVCDTGNHRVEVYDLDGKPLYDWGVHALLPHEGGGKLHYPSSIAIAPDGRRALVVEEFEGRAQLFGPAGERDIALQKAQEPNVAAHFGGAVAARGELVVACEPGAPGFLVYDTTAREREHAAEPVEVTRASGAGLRAGAFVRPSGIALSPDARFAYVADAGAHKIGAWLVARAENAALAYDPALARLSHVLDLERDFALRGRPGERAVPEPIALTCAADGTLFVLDAANQSVLVVSPALDVQRTFATARRRARDARRPGELVSAVDLAFVDGTDQLCVLDQGAGAVRVFSRAGVEITSFGAFGLGENEWLRPSGIAAAPDGTLFVSDEGRARVLHFELSGRFLGAFGKPGLGRVEFARPRGLACDTNGQLVVLDYGNHRAQTLKLDGTFVNAFGSRLFMEPTRERAAPRH